MRKKPYVLLELPADHSARMLLLDSMDVTIQPRHEGSPFDRTDQAEIYTIVNALRLGLDLPIPLPASVLHFDRPDVVIKSAMTCIGVEIVEAVSEMTAAMDYERARLPNAPEFHWATKQVQGERKKYAREVRELVIGNDPGGGFIGNGAAEWAEAIAYFVQRKIETVSKPGFQHYEQNWLLVYDNWREPARDIDKANITLQALLKGMEAFSFFDLVLVLDDKRLSVFGRSDLSVD